MKTYFDLPQSNSRGQGIRTRRSTDEEKLTYAHLLIETLNALFYRHFSQDNWSEIPSFVDNLSAIDKKQIWSRMAQKTGRDRTKLYKFYNNTLKPYVMPAWPREMLEHFADVAVRIGYHMLTEFPKISHNDFVYRGIVRVKDAVNYYQYMYKYPDNPAYSKMRNTLDRLYSAQVRREIPYLDEEAVDYASTDREQDGGEIDYLDSGFHPYQPFFSTVPPPISTFQKEALRETEQNAQVENIYMAPETSQALRHHLLQPEHSGTGILLDVFDSVEQ